MTAATLDKRPAGVLALLGTVLAGIIFFGVGMGISMGLVMLNARVSPALPWFPVPVLALAAAMTLWASRRWDIGLPGRPDPHPLHTWSLALAVTVLGVVMCILQGAGFGMVRAAETVAGVESPAFQLAYGVTLGVMAAILAEVTFRGILQTRFQAALGPWPAILLVAAINTAAHRWGPALEAQWAAYFISLAALGYLRVVTGSLVPPLVAHAVANFILGLVLWFAGPLDQGRLLAPDNRAGLVSLIALAGLSMVAIVVLRGLPGRR